MNPRPEAYAKAWRRCSPCSGCNFPHHFTNVWEPRTLLRVRKAVFKRTHNVTRWRDADMVERWVASAWLLTEKHFRKVIGHRDLWALAVLLGRERKPNANSEKVA